MGLELTKLYTDKDTKFHELMNNSLRRKNVRMSPMHLFANYMNLQLSNYDDKFGCFPGMSDTNVVYRWYLDETETIQ